MELRTFAETVLLSAALADKLRLVAESLVDDAPGEPTRVSEPARPPELRIAEHGPAMPHREAFGDPARRGVAHHLMANHELQALEVMAAVLLAFPDAPAGFRSGLAAIMADEQRHTRMHAERAAALGVPFGSLPVNGYIWRKAAGFESVLDFVAAISLVFEGANLDHTLELEPWFLEAGDERGAAVMRTIHRDEIQHVAFGLDWLRRLKDPSQSDWEAWQSHLHWPLRASKARGHVFHAEPRFAAGMSEDLVRAIERADAGPADDHPA